MERFASQSALQQAGFRFLPHYSTWPGPLSDALIVLLSFNSTTSFK